MKSVIFLLFITISCKCAIAQSKADKINALVKFYAEQQLFNGSVLVAEKGNVIYKNAVGMANMEWNIPNTTQTKFRVGSVTKQFTSMLIMQLVNEGKINLQKPIIAYLPNYRKETGDSITVHHLLTHSSGLPNYTDNNNFFGRESKLHFSVNDFIRIYCSGDLKFKPGARFSYSNSGYFILGAIIEAVTKKTYTEVLKERILQPLGMEHTGYDRSEKLISNRASGYVRGMDGFENADYLDMGLPYAAGSLYSTVEDLYLWNRALAAGKLIPHHLQQKLNTGYLNVEEIPFFKNDKDSVAYGWFVKHFSKADSTRKATMIWHSGGINGFLSQLARFPEEGYFIAMLDNTEGAAEPLLKDIIAVLYDLPVTEKKKNFSGILRQKIMSSSVKDAYQYYLSLDSIAKKQFDFSGAERQINSWGYQLMNDKKNMDDALKIFEINVKQFPNSSNVYDSYADALMRVGNFPLAIKNYKKSVALDSTNNNAKAMISSMLVKSDTLKVLVDGHEMVLYKTGNKGPVVVLEGGGNSTHTSWNSIVPELSKNFIVITYDRPGYLSSVSCSKPRTAMRVAEELKEALTKSGINGPYIVGGWSWGGAFARAFAAKYPAETKGLLLVDPAAKEVYDQMAAQYPDAFTRIFNERAADNHAAEDEFAAMMPTMHQASLSDKNYKGKIELLIAGSDREWSAFEKPLKKIWIDELVRWAKLQSHARYEIVNSGHAIQFEKPETVINAIKRMAN
jgi:CubicO group peptidase (beta-lactamase class C family)/pimeloyl-ACP methyl ester carboxylesterase